MALSTEPGYSAEFAVPVGVLLERSLWLVVAVTVGVAAMVL